MGLDQVESELAISQKRLTMFVKRLYTDKVIIAFTFLIVMGIVGIIVYATLNPNQKVRRAASAGEVMASAAAAEQQFVFSVVVSAEKVRGACNTSIAFVLVRRTADFQRARQRDTTCHDSDAERGGVAVVMLSP
jgi:hypothetical protein